MEGVSLKKIQEILLNPYLDEEKMLWILKDVILKYDFQEDLLIDQSESIKDLVNLFIDNCNNNHVKKYLIRTGFVNVDIKLGGFNLDEFVVIAGRPGMGKTQWMVNLILNFATNFPVQYFTFDLSKAALLNRFIACETGISFQDLMLNQLNKKESELLNTCKESLKLKQIFINDDVQLSLTAFISLCIEIIENKGVKVIVIDYLQLVFTYRFKNNREQQISLITRELKKLARKYNVCVIALSQLSRSVETRGGDKRPQLSDLRDSGAIEQDADKVLFLYRPEYYQITEDENGNSTINMMEVIVTKNLVGRPFTANLWVDDKFTKFYNNQSVNITIPEDRLNELS